MLGAIDAAADMYGATPPTSAERHSRRQTDVPARRVAMTVAHLLGFGYSEIGLVLSQRPFHRRHRREVVFR